jgi:hypothetical protein
MASSQSSRIRVVADDATAWSPPTGEVVGGGGVAAGR